MDWNTLENVTFEKGSKLGSIGNSAFSNCNKLKNIEIPDNVTNIREHAFSLCSSLTSVKFGDNSKLRSIERCAFFNCHKLENITIPDNVTSIRECAFERCSSLTSVKFGDNSKLRSIERCAFFNCHQLENIEIPNTVTSIGDNAFWNCNKLENIEIPNTVTSIGDNAFYGCSGLTSVTFGDNSLLRNIGDCAFLGCNKLENITIPDNVTSIGKRAFSVCSGLTSITIPDSVTSIGEYAFNGCSGLTSVYYMETKNTDYKYGTKEEWNKINIYGGNENLTKATIHYRNILTLKKIWKDGGDGSKRGIPQFVLEKNGVAIQTTDYRMDACLYEDIRDVFELTTGDNGNQVIKITEEAKGVDTWVYKFIVYDYDSSATYAVSEIEMDDYISSAKYIGNTGS